MIVVVGFVAVVAVALGRDGRWRQLDRLRFRAMPVAVAAMAIQVVIVNVAPRALPRGVADAVHLSTYGLAFAFLVANRRVRGLWLVAAGGLANLAAIASNGGVMPASRPALVAAGRAVKTTAFTNSTAVAHAKLAVLGDVFAWPRPLPLANVFSLGDIVLLAGVWLVLRRMTAPTGDEAAAVEAGESAVTAGDVSSTYLDVSPRYVLGCERDAPVVCYVAYGPLPVECVTRADQRTMVRS